jgi:hypothetical protein
MPVVRVSERDVDLILAEEFSVSQPFAHWFLGQLGLADVSDVRVLDATVSKVHHNLGESDLEVVFERTKSKKRFAILIEDKIGAPLQPEQVKRYSLRAEEACKAERYEHCHVVLCAPESYRGKHLFDKFISYEEIANYLRTRSGGDPRDLYRAQFLTQDAYSERCRSAFRVDGDRDSELMPITIPR